MPGIFGCLALFTSCEKEETLPPRIEMVQPTFEDEPHTSNNIVLEAFLSDESNIDYYKIWLKSEDGLEYYYNKVDVNDAHHHLYYDFELEPPFPQTLEAIILVVDDSGTSNEMNIKLK